MLSKLHESHIGRVTVAYYLSGVDLDPEHLTKITGIRAYSSAKRGDERRNYGGQLVSPHNTGFWGITSEGKVNSKDINDHISYLAELLVPYLSVFRSIIETAEAEAHFDVRWESSYLFAGTGPTLTANSVAAIASMNASVGFDIYQIEETSGAT